MNPKNIRELIEEGIAFPAILPEKNDFLFTEEGKQKIKVLAQRKEAAEKLMRDKGNLKLLDLDQLENLVGYTVPMIEHDYAAKTPVMWNTLYEKLGLNIRNIMLVADPQYSEKIAKAFRQDPKYLGGGFGVGFKEQLNVLDKIVPRELKAVNIVVKENGRLVGYNTDSEGFVRSLDEKLEAIGSQIRGGNFVIIGAGGVSKQVCRLLIDRGAGYIAIVNRTTRKAVALAHELNTEYDRDHAVGVGENMGRGVILNSEKPPRAIINLSDKGSDKYPSATMFYAAPDGADSTQIASVENISRTIARESSLLNPEVIFADITLPKTGRSKSLNIVSAELQRTLTMQQRNPEHAEKFILDGIGMVVYQAVPAYELVQKAHQEKHQLKTTNPNILSVFKEAAGYN